MFSRSARNSTAVVALCASVWSVTAAWVPAQAGSTPPTGAPANSKLCPDGTIKIGIAKAKTGGFALFDQPGGNGSMIAIDQLNAGGGVAGCKLVADWADTKSDPAVGKEVTTKLITDGAKVIIAPSDFDIGVGSSLAAKEANVFAISPEASSTDWPKAAGPNMVVTAITVKDLGEAQGKFANEKGWVNGYSVVNETYNFFTATEDAFKSVYSGKIADRSVVAEDATDYSAVISRIRGISPAPDFIYLADYFPHVGTFIKQLRDAGLDTPVLGNATYASPDLPKAVGETRMSQVYYASQSYYEGAGVAPAVQAFNDTYQQQFGTFPPNANSIAGFEGVMLLAKALEAAGTTDAAALAKAFSELTDVALPGSKVVKFVDGYTVRSSAIIGYDEAGHPKLVEQIEPSA